VSLRVWELAGGLVVAFAGVIFMLGGNYPVGIATLALLVFLLALRTRIIESVEIAGNYARKRGVLEGVQAIALGVVVLTVSALLAVALALGWNKNQEGLVAILALSGVSVLLMRDIDKRSESALNWITGGRAEARVGRELDALREAGWLVEHDRLRGSHRNVDHIFCGPGGAFAFETKAGSVLRRNDLGQARGNAAWLSYRLRQGWVTPVLCLDGGDEKPCETGGVWVMGTTYVRAWLEGQYGRAVNVDAAKHALQGAEPEVIL
jgi:hypothetical protein